MTCRTCETAPSCKTYPDSDARHITLSQGELDNLKAGNTIGFWVHIPACPECEKHLSIEVHLSPEVLPTT